MEFLKDVLGEELYNQVSEKLTGNDKVKLANLAGGQYIGKDKYDALDTTKKNLETQVADLKKVDTAGLQAQNEQLKKDLTATQLQSKLDAALMSAQAVNVTAVKALLDMSTISLDDSGKLVGADEQITALKESEKWAFVQPTVPGAGGNPPLAKEAEQKGTFADAITNRMESAE